MAEYIEREQALYRFTFYQGDRIPEINIDNFPNTVTIKDIKRILREIPAADVAPVVRGKWIKVQKENIWGDSIPVFECSICGKYTTGTKGIMTKFNYCPNCGAKMMED